MKKFTQIAGLAGVVLLALGAAVGGVQRALSLIVILHLAAGAGLIIVGMAANLGVIKETLAKRSLRIGPQVFLQGVLILAILFFLNVLVFRHDYIKDFTYYRLYTLQPGTRQVLSKIAAPVEVIAFFPGGGPPQARQRLELYAKLYPKAMNLRFVDPDKSEALAKAENIPPEVGVLFKSKTRRHWINQFDESDITNAFIIVNRSVSPRVWFVTGDGEANLDAPADDNSGLYYLRQMLTQQGYDLKAADLSTIDLIPAAVSAVVLMGPNQVLSEHAKKLLAYYLGQGGNAALFLDPLVVSGLETFCDAYGLRLRDDLIFDPVNHLAGDKIGLSVVATDLPSHEITDSLSQKRVVFYLSRSLEEKTNLRPDLSLRALVRTSPDSYEKAINSPQFASLTSAEERGKLFKSILEAGPAAADPKGPFALAYAVTKLSQTPGFNRKPGDPGPREMRLFVAGTSSICRNLMVMENYEFLVGAFNWLCGEKDLTSFAPPSPGGARLELTEGRKNYILYISVMILPELFMIIGLAVWWRRR